MHRPMLHGRAKHFRPASSGHGPPMASKMPRICSPGEKNGKMTGQTYKPRIHGKRKHSKRMWSRRVASTWLATFRNGPAARQAQRTVKRLISAMIWWYAAAAFYRPGICMRLANKPLKCALPTWASAVFLKLTLHRMPWLQCYKKSTTPKLQSCSPQQPPTGDGRSMQGYVGTLRRLPP